jgi:Domain of unknown function (DUF3786)
MKLVSPVFKETYKMYLGQIAKMDLGSAEMKIGLRIEGEAIKIPLFGQVYTINKNSISGPGDKKPSFDICIILCKYILLCPESLSDQKEWVAYRDFKDAGPLTTYFSNDVERAISGHFSGKINELQKACSLIGGHESDMDVSYDLAIRFDVLPRLPLLLLLNDGDEAFPAHCSVLFEKRADTFLDAECLAISGRLLFQKLTSRDPAVL